MHRTPTRKGRWLALLLVGVGGCGGNEAAVTTPRGAVDTVETNQVTKALLFGATDPFDPGAADATTRVAAAVDRLYLPPRCATATATDRSVTYTFANCAGPLGIVRVNGTVVVAYVQAGGSTQLIVNASTLSANDSSVNLNVQATYSRLDDTRRLDITDNSTGRGSYGNSVAQLTTGTLIWRVGDVCATLGASGSMQVAGDAMNASFSNTQFCNARCPSGTVFFNSGNEQLVLTLDGTQNAMFSNSKGETGNVAIVCGL